MKIKKLIYVFGILFLIGYSQKRTKLENAEYNNFSDLTHIEYPDLQLFHNYLSCNYSGTKLATKESALKALPLFLRIVS